MDPQRLAALQILVVGDVMLDRFVYGAVERINPEAPVPVLHVQREEFHAGGAANVAANLSGLGVGVNSSTASPNCLTYIRLPPVLYS